MAVRNGTLVADADGRSADYTGMVRDRVRKIGTTAAQTDAQILAATCDALRTHAVESVIWAGYAVPLPALNEIRRAVWAEAFDCGWAACEEAIEVSNAEAGS